MEARSKTDTSDSPEPGRPVPRRESWKGFEALSPELASYLWLSLMLAPVPAPLRFQLDEALVFMSHGEYLAAAELLRFSYNHSGDCLTLHLLGQIESGLGHDEIAKAHFLAEQTCLEPGNRLGQLCNAWQLGLIAARQRNPGLAEAYAQQCRSLAQGSENALAQLCAELLAREIQAPLKGLEPETEQALLAGLSAATSAGLHGLDLRLGVMVLRLLHDPARRRRNPGRTSQRGAA